MSQSAPHSPSPSATDHRNTEGLGGAWFVIVPDKCVGPFRTKTAAMQYRANNCSPTATIYRNGERELILRGQYEYAGEPSGE